MDKEDCPTCYDAGFKAGYEQAMYDKAQEKKEKLMTMWISVVDALPERGVLVRTRIKDENGIRNEQLLKRESNLWLFADSSMYVYYTPTEWQPADEADLVPEREKINKQIDMLQQRRDDMRVR